MAPGIWYRRRGARSDHAILLTGAVIVAVVLLVALFSPLLAPFGPETSSPDVSQPPPSLSEVPVLLWQSLTGQLVRPVHWFGTDNAGLDIFSRVLAAPRTDLLIAVLSNAFAVTAGTIIGLLCGFFGGRVAELVMRVSDVVQSFPILISGMILVALAGRNAGNIIITLGLLYTPVYLRLTRIEVMSHRRRGFVEASRAIGLSESAIAVRHVLPNSLAPLLIQLSVMIGFAILMTAGLSFVGAGVRPPTPELGLMIANGVEGLSQGDWWPSVFPGFAISITVFGFAALGNGLECLHAA
jgi:peptide/nickel transport system permease protein